MVLTWNDFISNTPLKNQPVSLTIGVFDGVHIGHRELIRQVLLNGKGSIPAVLTFNTNPRIVLKDPSYPGNIASLEQKIKILHDLGVDKVIVIDFSTDFSRLSGEVFLDLLMKSCDLKFLVLGENFRFGYRGQTASSDAERILAEKDVEVRICKMAYYGDEIVSSTRIRKAIMNGSIEEANNMLNRVFSLDIASIPQISGDETIKIDKKYIHQVLPPQGQYDTEVLGIGNIVSKTVCTIDNTHISVKVPGNHKITEIKFNSDRK